MSETVFTKERLTSAVFCEALGYYYVEPVKTVRPMIQFTSAPQEKKFSMPGDGVI